MGGNIFTLGDKPDGSPWVVAVDDPRSDGYIGRLSLRGDWSVSTSSGAQRYFVKDGVVYHHILDPAPGRTAPRCPLSGPGGATTCQFRDAPTPHAAAVLVREDGTVRILGDLDFTPESAA